MAVHSGIRDDGQHFQIVPTTRQVVVPPAYKVIGTVGDHNSEQLTFMCPKVIDGHDVVKCASHYVIWKNVKNETGRAEITNITTDGEYMYFTWVISSGVTAAAGFISFTIHFEDTTNGVVNYKWSTTTCKECQVLDTIQITSSDSGNTGDSGGTGDTYIPDGYVRPTGTIDIDSNGDYDVTGYERARVNAADNVTLHPITINENGTFAPDIGYAYSKAVVNVKPNLQEKTVGANGEYVADSGYDGLSKVIVSTPIASGTKAINKNGEYYIAEYEKVLVEVEGGDSEDDSEDETKEAVLQTKTIKANGEYEPDEEYDGFEKVIVKVPQTVYTGVEKLDGISKVYGGVTENVVIGGNILEFNDGDGTVGVAYTSISFPKMTTGNSLTTWQDGAGADATVTEVSIDSNNDDIEDAVNYKIVFALNGVSVVTKTVKSLGAYGIRCKWTNIYAPTELYPNGYAKVLFYFFWTDNTGTLNVQSNTNTYRYVQFSSEDEYNAALNLVLEPRGLVQIGEETFYFEEETAVTSDA